MSNVDYAQPSELNSENEEKAYIAESFKSTAMAKPQLMNNKICSDNEQQTLRPTPGFHQRKMSDGKAYEYANPSQDSRIGSASHLEKNHEKLV